VGHYEKRKCPPSLLLDEKRKCFIRLLARYTAKFLAGHYDIHKDEKYFKHNKFGTNTWLLLACGDMHVDGLQMIPKYCRDTKLWPVHRLHHHVSSLYLGWNSQQQQQPSVCHTMAFAIYI
jgi:hypothetical protein